MNNNLSVSRQHPIVFGIIVMAIFFVVMNLSAILLYSFGPEFLLVNGDWVLQGACECIVAIVGIILAAVFKVWKIWGERGRGFGRGLLTSMYFIVISLYSLAASIVMLMQTADTLELEAPWKICVFVATVFLIGFAEETFFRGIISNLFYEKHATDNEGVWTAVIGSGFVFGMMHLGNALSAFQVTATGRLSIDTTVVVGTLVQTASACVMGMALTAIYYRCRNIWALAFVHGVIDLCGAFTSGITKGGSLVETISTYTPFMFVSMIPYIILTLYLLRPKKMATILEYSHSNPSEFNGRLSDNLQDEPELMFCAADGSAQPSGKEAVPYQKSKRSLGIAIACAVAIFIALFALSVSLYMDTYGEDESFSNIFAAEVFSYESADSCDGGPTSFEKDLGSFEVDETRDYRFTITSYPGDSRAYATFYVRDSEKNLIYTESYGGRCSLEFNLKLKAGEEYNITVFYDFSAVTESMDYITKVTVK